MSGLWTDGQLYDSIKIAFSLNSFFLNFISGIVLHDLVKGSTIFTTHCATFN